MCSFDNLTNRVDAAQYIRNRRHGNKLGVLTEELIQIFQIKTAFPVNRPVVEFNSKLLTELLPGNKIGMMFHLGNQNPVSNLELLRSPGLCNQVHRCSGSTGENHFIF